MRKVTSSGAERRRYFRINDEVGLKYILKARDTVRDTSTSAAAGHHRHTDVLVLEQQIAAGLAQIRSQVPAVAAVLDLLNRKINVLVDERVPDTIEKRSSVICSVSLSACGIAFRTAEALPVGAGLTMELTLLPSHNRLNLEGVVIDCQDFLGAEDGPERYLARVDFLEAGEAEQEVLIHHVLACQSRDLRSRREARERGLE